MLAREVSWGGGACALARPPPNPRSATHHPVKETSSFTMRSARVGTPMGQPGGRVREAGDEGDHEREDVGHTIPPPHGDDVRWQLGPRQLVKTNWAGTRKHPHDQRRDPKQEQRQQGPADMEVPLAPCLHVGTPCAPDRGDDDAGHHERECNEHNRCGQDRPVLKQTCLAPPPCEAHRHQHGHADDVLRTEAYLVSCGRCGHLCSSSHLEPTMIISSRILGRIISLFCCNTNKSSWQVYNSLRTLLASRFVTIFICAIALEAHNTFCKLFMFIPKHQHASDTIIR